MILDLRIVVLSALSIALCMGCSVGRFEPSRPGTLDKLGGYADADLDADHARYEAAKDPEARRELRDRIVYKIALEIDNSYETFANAFFVDVAWTDTAIDVAVIGVNSAGTITGGASLKAILHATSAGLTGSRLSFAKNFFKEKSPEIIRARMAALRAQQWAIIYGKLGSSDAKYSLYEAARDLVAYFNAGTVKAAFDAIVAESGDRTKVAEKSLTQETVNRHHHVVTPTTKEFVTATEQLTDSLGRLRKLPDQKQAIDKMNKALALLHRPTGTDFEGTMKLLQAEIDNANGDEELQTVKRAMDDADIK